MLAPSAVTTPAKRPPSNTPSTTSASAITCPPQASIAVERAARSSPGSTAASPGARTPAATGRGEARLQVAAAAGGQPFDPQLQRLHQLEASLQLDRLVAVERNVHGAAGLVAGVEPAVVGEVRREGLPLACRGDHERGSTPPRPSSPRPPERASRRPRLTRRLLVCLARAPGRAAHAWPPSTRTPALSPRLPPRPRRARVAGRLASAGAGARPRGRVVFWAFGSRRARFALSKRLRSIGEGGFRATIPAPALPGSGSDGRRPGRRPLSPSSRAPVEDHGTRRVRGRETASVDPRMEAAVRALEAGWATRDFDLFRKHAAPDIVLDWSESVSPNRGVYRGIDEARKLFGAMLEAFSITTWEALSMTSIGHRLAIEGRFAIRGGSSGVETAAVGGQLWNFEEGRVKSVKVFQSGAEAVRAMRIARLEEAPSLLRLRGASRWDGRWSAARRGASRRRRHHPDAREGPRPGRASSSSSPVRSGAPPTSTARCSSSTTAPIWSSACSADGAHVGQDDPSVAEARRLAGADALIGLRPTPGADRSGLRRRRRGPARPDQRRAGVETAHQAGTASHRPGLVELAAGRISVPWFAIGGIDRDHRAGDGGRRGKARRRRAGDPRRG